MSKCSNNTVTTDSTGHAPLGTRRAVAAPAPQYERKWQVSKIKQRSR
jgi:hypothetical protein